MPLQNEHVARLRDPGDFDSETFRSKEISDGIRTIIGKLIGATKPDDPMVTESYHFSVDKFTETEAKDWLKKHDIEYIKFEPAKKTSEEEQVREVTRDVGAIEGKEIDKLKYKQFAIEEFKSGKMEDGRIFIEGYANTKNKPDRYGDIPTVYPKLRNYVYEIKEFVKNPVLLLDHDNNTGSIAGSFNPKYGGYAFEDDKGLKFKAIFSNSDLPAVKHAKTIYSEGHGRALSIGGVWHYEDSDNPKHLTKADIFEISLVGVGADPDALTTKKTQEIKPISKEIAYSEGAGETAKALNQAGLPEDEKVGRVLSKANENRLRNASDLLTQVLNELNKEEEEKSWKPKLKQKRQWKLTLKKSS